LLHFPLGDIVATSDAWVESMEANCSPPNGKLASGTYVIVPSAADAGAESAFGLRVFTAPGVVVDLRPLPTIQESYRQQAISGKWLKGLGGCFKFATWTTNAQFSLTVSSTSASGRKVKLTISLSQGDAGAPPLENPEAISFYIVKGGEDGKPAYDQVKAVPTLKFSKRNEVFQEVELEPGRAPYMIIPTLFSPALEDRAFTLCVWQQRDSEGGGDARLAEVPRENQWLRTSAKGAWSGLTAGGCINHPETWARNPTFVLEAIETTTCILILAQHHYRPEEPSTHSLEDGKYQIGLHVLSADNDGDVEAESREWDPDATTTLKVTLKKGKYRIRPSTFEPKQECAFTLTVCSSREIFLNAPAMTSKF
jgi:hypothetical protein